MCVLINEQMKNLLLFGDLILSQDVCIETLVNKTIIDVLTILSLPRKYNYLYLYNWYPLGLWMIPPFINHPWHNQLFQQETVQKKRDFITDCTQTLCRWNVVLLQLLCVYYVKNYMQAVVFLTHVQWSMTYKNILLVVCLKVFSTNKRWYVT